MATLVGENRGQEETALSFKPGGSHIQIDSISIEISSGDINEAVEECKHFSIRGFVSEQRKKDSRLCSPFISDGDGNNSNTSSLELPPLEVQKFRWWRCSGCLQDCNSSQGTSKETATGKSIPSGKQSCLHKGGSSKGLFKLFAKAAGNGFTSGSCTSQRSAKGKQVQEGGSSHEVWKGIVRDPLTRCGNSQSKLPPKSAKGKRLLQDDISQGPSKENIVAPFSGLSNSRGASFTKSVSEAVMVPFNSLDFDKARPSRKSVKDHNLQKGSSSGGMSKVVMGPPGGFANDKAITPKSSKEHNLQKSVASPQGTSNEFAMPPPGGFSNAKQSSHKSGKGSRLQHLSFSRGASKDPSMLPLTGYGSGKSTSASKQQNVQTPKPNARIWQKGETSAAGTLHKKRNYAKRSVQQADIAGDRLEIHKAGENGFASNSNRETLQHGIAKEGDIPMPERFNDDQVPFQLDRNEEVGSSNKLIEQVSNYSTAGRAPNRASQSQLEHNQSAEDGVVDVHSYPHKDGTDKYFTSVRPSVESNRLFKRPRIDFELEAGRNNMYEEEEEEDYRGMHLRRVPKIRLLSDVIAKYPTNVGEQPDNSKASPGASNDISPRRGISAKFSEQSTKRKPSPVASHDTSAERGVSDKAGEQLTKPKASPVVSHDTPAGRGVSVSGSWKKRKRCVQDGEEHLADSSTGGAKRSSVRFAEPENKTAPTSRFRSDVDVSAEATLATDAKRQGKHALERNEVEKKSKKARVENVVPSSVPSQPRHVSRDNSGRPLPSERFSSGEAVISRPVHGGHFTDRGMDISNKNMFSSDKTERIHGYGKKNIFSQIGEDCQSATKFLQFGPSNVENAPGEGTSDCIIIGSGFKRRSDAVENCENSSTPSSTVADYRKTSVSTGNELWIPQVQAGGTLVERKGGEGSSCTQQKGFTAEAKGRMKDIDINSIPVDDKTPEPGSADDIPMDIVELLAKHQHERRCDANREKLISLLQPNGESTAQKSYPSMLKPQASYASNGFGRQFEVMGSAKQNLPDNVFEPSRKNVLVGYHKDDPFYPRFTGYTESQGQVPGGAQYSSSIGSTAKSWTGNTGPFRPTSRGILQPVQSFNRYPGLSSPPLNTQIWPPLMPNRVPLGGLANQGMYSQGSDMLQMGKVSQGTISFNFERPTMGNPNPSSTQSWNSRTSEYANGGRQKTTEFLPPKVMRPVDLTSNETIPAMQLLNLVQVAGSRTSTPPVNGNAEFLKKLPFDNSDNQYKHYASGPHFEPYNKPTAAGPSSRHPLYDGVDKRCPCSSALPAPQMFAASAFQNDPTAGRSSGLKNPMTFTPRDQRNMAGTCYTPLVRDLCSDKKRKSASAGKNATVSQGAPTSSSNIVQPVRKSAVDIVPRGDVHKAEVCMINRNPAEILDLKEVRSFMIGAEDLRRGKAAPNARRPQTVLKGKGRERLHKC